VVDLDAVDLEDRHLVRRAELDGVFEGRRLAASRRLEHDAAAHADEAALDGIAAQARVDDPHVLDAAVTRDEEAHEHAPAGILLSFAGALVAVAHVLEARLQRVLDIVGVEHAHLVVDVHRGRLLVAAAALVPLLFLARDAGSRRIGATALCRVAGRAADGSRGKSECQECGGELHLTREARITIDRHTNALNGQSHPLISSLRHRKKT
jgi:hypothetical protein